MPLPGLTVSSGVLLAELWCGKRQKSADCSVAGQVNEPARGARRLILLLTGVCRVQRRRTDFGSCVCARMNTRRFALHVARHLSFCGGETILVYLTGPAWADRQAWASAQCLRLCRSSPCSITTAVIPILLVSSRAVIEISALSR